MQPATTPVSSNRRRRGTSGGTGTNLGLQSSRVPRPSGRLQTEEAVLEDIIATAGGDFTQYPDIVEISRGQLQYSPTPSIVWPNAAVLKNSISTLQEEKRISEETSRAVRIANAVGSAVVIFPTTGTAQLAVLTICLGSVVLLFTRQPWSDEGLFTLKGFADTFVYTLLPVTLAFILVKTVAAKSAATGAARQDTGVPTP